MSLTILFIILFFFVMIIVIKDEKKRNNILDELDDFEANDRYMSGISIAYDNKRKKERKKVCLLEGYQTKIYDYKDIIQSELEVDGETKTITTQSVSTNGMIGRAIVGGVLTGGVGAIIGGVTASRKSKSKEISKTKSINLKITVNDTSNPIYRIEFLDYETKKGSWTYNSSYKSAEKWHGKMSAIIKQVENNLSGKSVMPNSTADELLKLKELLDLEALSKEEFESAKFKLLNS